jgi:hypothetical protein
MLQCTPSITIIKTMIISVKKHKVLTITLNNEWTGRNVAAPCNLIINSNNQILCVFDPC